MNHSMKTKIEALLEYPDYDLEPFSLAEIKSLIRDMWQYQLELELQNQNLQKSQHHFEAIGNLYLNLFDLAPVGYLVLAASGRILKANQTFSAMIGVNPEDLRCKPFCDFIDPRDLEFFQSQYGAFFTQADDKIIKIRLTALSGASLCVRLEGRLDISSPSFSELFSDPGEAQGALLVIATDISERQKTEDALQRELTIDASLTEVAASLLGDSDIDDTSYMVLENAKKLTDSRFGFVGYIDTTTGNFISATMTRDIWNQCNIHDKTVVFKKFGGLWGWVLNHKTPLLTNHPAQDHRSSGTPAGHIQIHRFISVPVLVKERLIGLVALANSSREYSPEDLHTLERLARLYGLSIQRMWSQTELTAAKEAAEAANSAKSCFLATMSHEIRTPMNAVIGMTHLLQGTQLNEQQTEFLQIIKEAAGHLLRLLDDILQLSKIEAGKIEIEMASFKIRESLETVMRAFELKAQEKGLALSLEVEEAVPEVLIGDSLRLNQVIINLIGNALKFTEKGRIALRVSTERIHTDVAILAFAVSDTGIGIPTEKQDQIFEPFSQADASTTRKYGGTGLGLTICKRIVAAAGGKISLTSVPGQGSVFTFTFCFKLDSSGIASIPADFPVAAPQLSSASREKTSFHKPIHILLVEDNVFNQKFAVILLEKKGYRVTLAGNGREALDLYAKDPPDIILMDVEMPLMDGIEATQRIRLAEKNRDAHTPIIAMTAHAIDGDRERIMAGGMDDYLAKPIDPEALYKVIEALTQRNNG